MLAERCGGSLGPKRLVLPATALSVSVSYGNVLRNVAVYRHYTLKVLVGVMLLFLLRIFLGCGFNEILTSFLHYYQKLRKLAHYRYCRIFSTYKRCVGVCLYVRVTPVSLCIHLSVYVDSKNFLNQCCFINSFSLVS